jgi:hypothetical protein
MTLIDWAETQLHANPPEEMHNSFQQYEPLSASITLNWSPLPYVNLITNLK